MIMSSVSNFYRRINDCKLLFLKILIFLYILYSNYNSLIKYFHYFNSSANVALINTLHTFAKRIRQEEDVELVRKLHEWWNLMRIGKWMIAFPENGYAYLVGMKSAELLCNYGVFSFPATTTKRREIRHCDRTGY